jgi:cytochrome P450
MTTAAQHDQDFDIIHPDDYAAHGYPHALWKRLRAEEPVSWWENTAHGGRPFWVITKHADIIEIGKQPDKFASGPRLVISHESEDLQDDFPPTLIQLDPPKHGKYRKIVSSRFTPRYLTRMHEDIDRIGREIVDELLERGNEGEIDFVKEVSAPLPIAVIAWMLGLPKSDWNLLFDWTNRLIGANDPEFRREGMTSSESAQATMVEVFEYFTKLVDDKRKNPADDLVTLFANAKVDGEPLEFVDVLTFCLIIVVAGNETTRNATSGGMLAFVEHPDERRKVVENPALMPTAVEEVVRWTSPIIHFARTANVDYELRGKTIKQGDAMALFYPSANRDEEIFEDPYVFRADRDPNPHLAFGVGEHFCLGAHVARLEMIAAYKHLLPRLAEVELNGPIERLHSSLVGGVKHLPLRYRLN